MTADKNIELYFVQFIFCKNREILLRKNRGLYDALLKKYTAVYKEGASRCLDLLEINHCFVHRLFWKKEALL